MELIKDEWKKSNNSELSIQELSKIIAEKLSMIDIKNEDYDYDRLNLIDRFIDLSEDEEIGFDDFNYVMNDLYDWGDIKVSNNSFWGEKLCWIKTF